MRTNCLFKFIRTRGMKIILPCRPNIDCGIFCVVFIFVGVNLIGHAILAGIVKNASHNCNILANIGHISPLRHSHEFVTKHNNGFSVANKTALSLGKVRMEFSRSTCTSSPEYVRCPIIEIIASKTAKRFVLNKRNFLFKQF